MSLKPVLLSYPDFKMYDIIDPEQFDTNNAELQEKINEVVVLLNKLYVENDNATAGSELITVKPFEPFTEADNIQTFLEQLVERLQSVQSGASGAEFIGTPTVGNIEGNTVHAQMLSIDAKLRELLQAITRIDTSNTTLNSAFTNHNHNKLYYTKEEMDEYLKQRDTTVHADVFTITSVNNTSKTFTYRDNNGYSYTSSIDGNGSMLFTLSDIYEPNANLLTVIVDDVLNLSAISGGLVEVSESQFKTTTALNVGQELTCRYSKRVRNLTEYSLSYGTQQPVASGGSDMWFKVVG